ncbi:MAG TPA: DUF6252 family protein [Bacteroidia bacterium]|nr:DUF6252 family protein [Bacteroidia bacterium]
MHTPKNNMIRLIAIAGLVLTIAACGKTIDNTGTCSDGIKNQGEQEVDCGGPCPAHCASCADGILNQGETAIDCGGPCDPCYPRFSALIDSTDWWSTSRNGFLFSPTEIHLYGTDSNYNLTLIYSGPFAAGTISEGPLFRAELRNITGVTFLSVSGSITFTTFDTAARTVSGSFTFGATDTSGGGSHQIEKGVFNVISY